MTTAINRTRRTVSLEAMAASRHVDARREAQGQRRAPARTRRTLNGLPSSGQGRYFAPVRNSRIRTVLAMITRSRSKLIFLT